MARFIEMIEDVERQYYGACKREEFEKVFSDAEKTLRENLSEQNRQRLSGLIVRIKLKEKTLAFLCGKIGDEDFLQQYQNDLTNLQQEYISIYGSDKDYSNSQVVLAIRYFIDESKKLTGRVQEIENIVSGCLSADGIFIGTTDDYRNGIEKLEKMKRQVCISSWKERFPQTKGDFCFDVEGMDVKEICEKAAKGLRSAFEGSVALVLEKAKKHTLQDYADEVKFKYIPDMIVGDAKEFPSVQFICTPLEDEFTYLLAAYQSGSRKSVLQMKTGWILTDNITKEETVRERIKMLLAVMDEGKTTDMFAVYDMNMFLDGDDDHKKALQAIFSVFSEYVREQESKGRTIHFAIQDTSGDKDLLAAYSEVEKLVLAGGKYLSLPRFGDVEEILRKRGFDKNDMKFVHDTVKFIGFVGLNKMLFAQIHAPTLWRSNTEAISGVNYDRSRAFLRELVDPSIFIPKDWDFAEKTQRQDGGVPFAYDYDEIKEISNEVIDGIIRDPNKTVYEKIHDLLPYSLLAGEDYSKWNSPDGIEESVKKERITQAVRLCAFVMRSYVKKLPDVTFSNETEGEWGGYCRAASEVVFKEKDIKEYDWIIDAIPHELYHAVQYIVTSENISKDWYKKTYRLSEERIASWADNNKCYTDIDDDRNRYWVQVKEVDAREFAGLCFGDRVYHKSRI